METTCEFKRISQILQIPLVFGEECILLLLSPTHILFVMVFIQRPNLIL